MAMFSDGDEQQYAGAVFIDRGAQGRNRRWT